MRILIVEDEPQLARHIRAALIRHGHAADVEADGLRALQTAVRDQPDLVLLDINLPSLDGFEVLGRLRQAKCAAMVLMLTARGEVSDRIRGLKSGADDYLAKPFAIDELIARVATLARRGGAPLSGSSFRLDDLHLNVPQRNVIRGGRILTLSPREFDLLQVMMQEPGRVFARTELRDRVWQGEPDFDVRIIDMFITRLRKKIDADSDRALIHTVRNVGYTLRLPS